MSALETVIGPEPEEFAKRLASSIAARERLTCRRRAWQDSAAVLAWFRPSMIGGPSTGEERLSDEDWIAFLADTEVAPAARGGARRLREPVRRAVLTRLKPDLWKSVRASVRDAPDDPVQRMLDTAFSGRALQLEKLERAELDALITVSRWLAGVAMNLPAEEAITSAIARMDLLAPLRRLTEHFVGRDTELDTLRAYVEEIVPKDRVRRLTAYLGDRWSDLLGRKTLILHGPGGVGKSTLVAQFLLEHADGGLPFIYIDLDRPSIDPRNPWSLLAEAQRQLTLQAPRVKVLAERLASAFEQASRERASSEASRSLHSLGEAVAGLVRLVNAALPPERRLPFVIDTFEEAQALGDEALPGLATLVAELARLGKRIRPVICGRVAPPADLFDGQAVPVHALEPVPAACFVQQLLAKRYELHVDRETLLPLMQSISCTPLTLSLAAQMIARHGVEAVPQPTFLGRLLHVTDAAELYSRILGHIKDGQLRALAKPGLLVRRLTPAVVCDVLAAPCGLSIDGIRQAEELLERLACEVSLVEREPDRALKHRQDVRRQMLPSLERAVGADVTRQINEAAAAFYEKAVKAVPSDPVALAEQLYHLLRLGNVSAATALWSDKDATQAAVERLRAALNEIRPEPRRALKHRLGMRLTADERKAASQDEWEYAAGKAAAAYLSDGGFQAAATILSERAERLPESRLPLLEVEAFSGLGEWRRVIEIAEPAAERAIANGNARDAFALIFAAARAREALGDYEGAIQNLVNAEAQARWVGDMESLLRVAAARARVADAEGTEYAGEPGLEVSVAEALMDSGVLDRLDGAALRECAAALGSINPSLIRAALFRLGLPELNAAMIAELAQILAKQTRAGGEKAENLKAVLTTVRDGELPENVADPETWQAWLADVPGFHLGRALAELIQAGNDTEPRLLAWAQRALQGRVERDVHGASHTYLAQGTYLRGADLQGAHLRNADLQGADLQGSYLRGADLQGADLQGSYLRGADLQGADLQGSYLRNADLQGAHLRNADLQGADLQRAYLRDADLQGADLQGAHLRNADLQGADLQGAHLRGADLQRAYLRDADLQGADLQGAHLRNADLQGADLQGAHLRNADLQEANLEGAYLQGAILLDVQGLMQEQLDSALGNDKTLLPEHLTRPVHWMSSKSDGPAE